MACRSPNGGMSKGALAQTSGCANVRIVSTAGLECERDFLVGGEVVSDADRSGVDIVASSCDSASAFKTIAVSSALRVVIPGCDSHRIVSSAFSPSRMPLLLIAPNVALNPTTPQHAAGKRHDPIASVSRVA